MLNYQRVNKRTKLAIFQLANCKRLPEGNIVGYISPAASPFQLLYLHEIRRCSDMNIPSQESDAA